MLGSAMKIDDLPPVPGFQLVHAAGLADTATPPPVGSSIPSFATPSPSALADPQIQNQSSPADVADPPPLPPAAEPANPLEQSKSEQFSQRLDFMIAQFFSRQVKRLAAGTPLSIDRNYRIFQQRFKERLGSQWAHITAQPEVDEAFKQVQDMHDFFLRLERMVERHKIALEKLNDVDIEMSLFYQQQIYHEHSEAIRKPMQQLSASYRTTASEREPIIAAYTQYKDFLTTFREKAITDALETMKKQQVSRLELDGYGSRLGQLEEKKLKTYARSALSTDSSVSEKELETTRQRFQEAKTKYQSLSTQMIDKAGLLDLKRQIDFSTHLNKVAAAHSWFCRGFITVPPSKKETVQPIPDEDALNDANDRCEASAFTKIPTDATDHPVDVTKLKGFGSETFDQPEMSKKV